MIKDLLRDTSRAKNASAYFEREVLRDGSSLVVRSVVPEDKSSLQGIVMRADAESRYYRFFCAKKMLTEQELRYFTEIDFVSHVGLIACLQINDGEYPVGVVRYIIAPDRVSSAEVGLLVEDSYQRLGIGTVLIKHLMRLAVKNGVTEFSFDVMFENTKMRNFLRTSPLKLVETNNTILRASLSDMLAKPEVA